MPKPRSGAPGGGSRRLLLGTFLGALLAAAPVAAQAPDGGGWSDGAPAAPGDDGTPAVAVNEARLLLDEANRLDDTTRAWKDRSQKLELRIVDGRGNERLRELTMKTLKRAGGEDKTITVFRSPPEVRGTSFLQFAHRDRDAEQWLFLPALNRVRQISAQSKNESFMGTDFSYRDLELLTDVIEWNEEEASATLVGTETIGDAEASVIELMPRKKDVGYERIRVALSKPDLVIRRMEFFPQGAESPKKVLRLDDIEVVDSIPTPMVLEMVQPAAGSKTFVTVSDVRYDQDLSDDLFTSRALERGVVDGE